MSLGNDGLEGCRWITFAFAGALLFSAALPASAGTTAEAQAADATLVSASDQLLAALGEWEQLPAAARGARVAALVQRAQQRQERLEALLIATPRLAAARMLPGTLARRLPAQVMAFVEQEVSLEGSVYARVVDNHETGASRTEFKFQPSSGGSALTLHLADATGSEEALRRWAGRKLSLKAMRLGEHLTVLDRKHARLLDGSIASAAVAPAIQGDQKTLAILVNFKDKALSCTPANVAARLFGSSGATVNNNYRESSRGLVSFSGQAVGPFTIDYMSTGSCTYLGWAAAAEAAAKAAGIDPALYARVSYVTPPNASCGWTGQAFMPGRQTWIQQCGVTGTFSHELGHNLSFDHAATPTFDYGDGSDPMGGSQMVGHNSPNRVMAGWIPADSVLDVISGGSYALATLSTNAAATSPQVLRIAKPESGEFYYVSLRQALNLDMYLPLKYLDTLSVHRASGMLPAKTTLLQNLAVGQTFSDGGNGITVTNQGLAGGVATVGITFGGATCVRNAPLISVTPASQTAGAGASLAYTVNVTNTHSAACGASTFNLSQTLPSGFSGTFSSPALSVAAGASGASTWTVTSASTAANATYTLTATAIDSASGLSASTYASDIVYSAPNCVRSAPQVSVTPSPQSGNAGTTLAYTVGVTNRNSSPCGSSTFNLAQALPAGFSGAFAATYVSIAPGASASSTWSVGSASTLAAGSYSISASALEASVGATAGSGSATNTVTSAADNTPPVVTFASPVAGATISGRNVTLSASASDASGIRSVAFYVDGKLITTDTSGPFSASWNLNKVAKGAHTLTARATDNAGNVAEQSIVVYR